MLTSSVRDLMNSWDTPRHRIAEKSPFEWHNPEFLLLGEVFVPPTCCLIIFNRFDVTVTKLSRFSMYFVQCWGNMFREREYVPTLNSSKVQ